MTTLEQNRLAQWLRAITAVFLFVLVLALYPYTGDPTNIPKILVYHWFAFLVGAVWLIGTWLQGRGIPRPPVFFYPLIGLLLLFTAAAVFSSYPEHSFVFVRRLAVLVLVYALIADIYRTPEQMARLMLVFCIAVALASLYGFAQRFGYDPFPWANRNLEEYRNMPATFGNPNFAGHTLVLATLLAVYLAITDRRRWYCWGFAALYVVHLHISQTRGSSLALAAAAVLVVLAMLFARTRYATRTRIIAVLVVFVLLGILGVSAGCALLKAQTGDPYPLDTSLLLRYNGYYTAARMMTHHPALGLGPGVYEYENIHFWTPFEQWWFAYKQQLNQHVHNSLLETAVDAGIGAAVLFLALLILGIVHGLRLYFTEPDPPHRRLGLIMAAFFLAFLVDGFFGFNFRVPVSEVLLFVAMGFIEASYLAKHPRPAMQKRFGTSLFWRAAAVSLAGVSAFASTNYFVSRCYLQQGRGAMSDTYEAYGAAHRLFLKGAALVPWDYDFPLHAGLASFQLGNYRDSVNELKKALSLRPDYITTLTALAQAEREAAYTDSSAAMADKLSALDDARFHAERVVQLCPDFADAHEILGRIAATKALELTGNGPADEVRAAWEEAEHELTLALGLGVTERPRVLVMLARTRLALAQYDTAAQAVREAVQLDPSNQDAWQTYSEIAAKAGRYDGFSAALAAAMAEVKRGSSPDPHVLAMLNLWQAYVSGTALNEPDKALRAYIAAVQYEPERPGVWNDFATYARTKGFVPQFRGALLEWVASARAKGTPIPPNVEAVALAWQDGADGLKQGIAHLDAAVDSKAFDISAVPLNNQVAWAAQFLLAEAQRYVANMPDIAVAIGQLGGIFKAIGAPETAEQLLKSALPYLSAEETPKAAADLAGALQQLDRPGEAISILRQAVRRVPGDVELHIMLARALVAEGRKAEARIEYMTILRTPNLTPEGRKVIEEEMRKPQTP